jgi:hypothetical protein
MFIEMTAEEGRAVLDVLAKVGGFPESTRRGLTDKVFKKIEIASGTNYSCDGAKDLEGNLVFQSVEVEVELVTQCGCRRKFRTRLGIKEISIPLISSFRYFKQSTCDPYIYVEIIK